jgi:integrase
LLQVGRWLATTHPDITSPTEWTRELAAEYVAAVDRATVGQWGDTAYIARDKLGQPLAANTKKQQLTAVRCFFQDCQEWGWIERRFDPQRSFRPPLSVRACPSTNPRAIADDVWAKLLWAGLNLTADDLPAVLWKTGDKRVPHRERRPSYPPEMVRAITLVWLFAGLRSDEIRRLRLGCIRWKRGDTHLTTPGEAVPRDAVCWLDVPVNKTGSAFTKPVDRVVGQAIVAWEAVRPAQPRARDAKTGEAVDYLFSYRGRQIGVAYFNDRLIPLLCRKAGVPPSDARGTITSHRARSTIATQLFNAKEPLSLFELQEWLGHRSPQTTQYYAKMTPTKLAKSFQDAGYFGRNLRLIEVLLDQAVIKSGATANGEPWRFYDLGHGYCTYDFFDQCPHRMACAKCDFYLPKGSTRAQLLEGTASLQRMLQEIPLTDDERAAVEDGVAAHERLLAKLMDVPTPAGPTPRELAGEPIIPLRPVPSPPAEAGA